MEYNAQTTYRELYKQGIACLQKAQIAEAELDARLLLEWCCDTNRNTLLVHGERSISPEEFEKYEGCISKRAKHIPLQHITGEQEFMGLTFEVNEHVLIPRQDTEILVEEAMRHLHDGMKILDMCTGSGCILLSLLHYSNDCVGVGVDISEEALNVAKRNGERMKALKENLQVSFLQSNLFEVFENPLSDDMGARFGMDARFDMIVSNPPYIRSDVIQTLMLEVREHEPILALDGTEDGLYFYRNIIENAGKYLIGGGKLFFEIGYDQGEDVKRLMEQEGYKEVEVIKDFAGLDRVVCGTLQK
ncbi:MAG: peptide chain release factor N(5)-glutamine methyltransferase [Lachnospiraceae bacterium]|nr:peptide chain release factor N(5)-glutamine methyltransferase [Lachnospiraceae bacterium]